MPMRFSYFAVLAAALAAMPTPGRTETPTPPSGVSGAAAANIDPDSITALHKMGEYLRGLKAFQVEASTSTQEVLEDGQKVTYHAKVNMLAAMPDRLRAEVTSDRQQRMYLYNGKEFTLWAERVNYYATLQAPSTIAELANRLADDYDIHVPLVDLFYWGTPRSKVGDIKSSIDIGPSVVEGVTCEQYAFRQEGLDWQIWIQLGDYPLPRKLVLTTLTDEARPEFTSVMTWNLAPSFNDAAFTFDPPKDAEKIVFAGSHASATGLQQ
jgi:hypothetical protein